MSTTPTNIESTSAMPSMPSGNFEDRASAALSSALSTDTEPSQAESVEDPAQQADETTTELQPDADTSDDPAAVATATEEGEPDPYADPEDADPAVIEQFLKTPRGREIHQGYKFVQELRKPTSEGGIGHAPTVQDIRQYFDSHRGAVQMYADYNSGDPRRIANVLGHFFGPNPQTGQMSPSAAAALQNLEPTLAQFGPQAYEAVAAPVMTRYESALMDKWRGTQDPQLKQALYQTVQILHKDMHGEWLPEAAFKSGATGAQQQSPAPNADRQRLDAEWGRLNQERATQQRARWDQWQNKFIEAENAAFGGELDKALKPLAAMKEKTPEIYAATRERFAQQVRQALMQDAQVWGLYEQQIDQARRSGDPAAIAQVVQRFTNLAVPAIAARRTEYLKGAGVILRQQSQDKHAQLRQIASHAAPSNSGAPSKRVNGNPQSNLKLPGETREAYFERRLRQASAA